MIAPSARRTAVLAAAIITGAAASAFGQQLANLDDDQRLKSHLKIECPRGGDACEIPAAKRFFDALTAERLKRAAAANKTTLGANKVTAEAKQGIALEEQLQRCTAFLRGKRAEGVVFDRQITRANVCPYAIELGMRDGPG